MMVLSGATRRLDTQLDRETVPVGPGLRLCSTYPACKGGRKARGGGQVGPEVATLLLPPP